MSNAPPPRSAHLSTTTQIMLAAHVWFDLALYTLCTPEKTILLTPHEARVLEALLQRPNRCHSAEELVRKLKKRGTGDLQRHALQQTIVGLRRKLDQCGQDGQLLHTRRGFGYLLLLNQSSETTRDTSSDTAEGTRGQA